jgi:hypothetical protein
MDGAWETPLPDAKPKASTAIHAHCLLLYFLDGQNVVHLCAPTSCRIFLTAFQYHLLFTLRHVSSCPLPQQPKGKTAQAHDATGSASENMAQHRFGVHMRYRWGKPNDHRIVQAPNRACTDIQ